MTARGGQADPQGHGSAPRFTPSPEAVEAVAQTLYEHYELEHDTEGVDPADFKNEALAAIAAFVEAEGLHIQTIEPEREIRETVGRGELHAQRLVGPWRKRD